MRTEATELSTLEFHVLLSLAAGPLHGYAIKEAVAEESAGTLTPAAGSLYRVIARLITAGFVIEAEGIDPEPHPGLPRRYYKLPARGRRALAAEVHRLKRATAMAEQRLRIAQGRP